MPGCCRVFKSIVSGLPKVKLKFKGTTTVTEPYRKILNWCGSVAASQDETDGCLQNKKDTKNKCETDIEKTYSYA